VAVREFLQIERVPDHVVLPNEIDLLLSILNLIAQPVLAPVDPDDNDADANIYTREVKIDLVHEVFLDEENAPSASAHCYPLSYPGRRGTMAIGVNVYSAAPSRL